MQSRIQYVNEAINAITTRTNYKKLNYTKLLLRLLSRTTYYLSSSFVTGRA